MTAVRKTVRRRRPSTYVVVATALVAGLVFAFSAAALPGSNFEITDGNLIVNGAPPALDWANVNEQRQTDLASGSGDNSFGQGAKEDTPVPAVVDGSIPNNKSDLLNFGVYLEENASGRFLNLFWRRVQEPNGTTNMDFEFNKSKVLSTNGVTPVRTEGDVLIQYDLSQGGTNPTLWASRWVTSGAGSQCEANNAVPCWSTRVNLTAAGIAAGSINLQPISAADSDGLGAMSARTFGEAQVDLDALQGGGGPQCAVFGSAYLKSRSSDSFNSELKDFIAPMAVDLDQCANVIIRKQTDPADQGPTFGYTKSISTAPASANTFTLKDDGSQSYDNVLLGNGYTVVEDQIPAGWDFVSIDCSASSGVTPSFSGAQITFSIDSKDDVLDCTYLNRSRGTVIIEKVTEDSGGAFGFTSNTLSPSSWTLTTSAAGEAGKDSRTFGDLVPGTYDAAETEPAGWNLVSATCSDGSPVSAIAVSGGETVTCRFVNRRERGAILITKLRKHAAGGSGDQPHPGVSFTVNGTSVVTDANGQACVENLLMGDYTVTETLPAGYINVGPLSQTVSVVAEATCAAGPKAQAEFHNMPLTDITVSVNSQIDGGTASTIDCGDAGDPETSARPCRAPVSRTYSSRLPPATETITCGLVLASRGSSSAMNASMPGFWTPVDHTMPDGDSASRGVGDPFSGSTVTDRLTRPPTLRSSTRPASSRPVPAHPAAMSTGVGTTSPPRSTERDRFTPATTAPPATPRAASAASSAPRRAIGPRARAPG